jgi:hypothetical protein
MGGPSSGTLATRVHLFPGSGFAATFCGQQHALCERPAEHRWTWTNPEPNLKWNGANGYVFGDTKYGVFDDPQCQNMTTAPVNT